MEEPTFKTIYEKGVWCQPHPTDKPVLANVLSIAKEFDCSIKTLSTDLIAKEGQNLIQFTLEVVFNSKEGKSTEFITKLSKETDAVDIYTLTNHR